MAFLRWHGGGESHSVRILSIDTLPGNFPEFVDEIAAGLAELYGPGAGEVYRRVAPKSVEAAMCAPRIKTYCAQVSGEAAGLAMARFQDEAGWIPFIHVLARHCGKHFEHRLIKEAVISLRAGGVDRIVSECIPFCDIGVRESFGALGFRVFPRQLMMAETEMVSHVGAAAARSVSCSTFDMRNAAETIAAAYRDHPERELHADVQDADSAERFIQATLHGTYGLCRSEYVRVIREHDRVAGVILGCEMAPGVGFVLQVAVRPDSQNRGMGETLMRDVASAFLKRGMKRIALGVTLTSGACRLYDRIGFEPLRAVDAFVWHRP